MTSYSYSDSQLEVFALASNWKAYFQHLIGSYIVGEVLEVGAGIGMTTKTLCRGRHARWVCLEPDPAQAARIEAFIADGQIPDCCEVRVGTVADLAGREEFDTVLYIDVLEHIENDREEVALASSMLRSGGHLIVLSPAHPRLFTTFDAMVGHYRRYTKKSLAAVIPGDLKRRELFYLDSVGAIASAGNRYILRSGKPSQQQILFWDRAMIPLSRIFDPLFAYRVGKSLIGIWQKT